MASIASDAANTDDFWNLLHTEDGEAYYYNRKLSKTQWEKPDGYIVDLANELQQLAVVDAVAAAAAQGDSTSLHQDATNSASAEEEIEVSVESTSVSKITRQQRIANSSKWSVYNTATYGTGVADGDAGDIYYVNSETGESTWERPSDFLTPEQIRELLAEEETDFDASQGLAVCFDTVGIMSPAAADECSAMHRGDMGAGALCANRLSQLLMLVQRVGEESEWDTLLAKDNFALPFRVATFLGSGLSDSVDAVVRLTVARVLAIFSQIHRSVLVRLVNGEWGTLAGLGHHISAGLDEAKTAAASCSGTENTEEGRAASDEALRVWLMLTTGVLTETQSLPLPAEDLASDDFVNRLFDLMADASESVFLEAAKVVLAMNVHLAAKDPEESIVPVDTEPNVVMRALITHPKSEYFGEALLHLLNKQHYPYNDRIELRQMLRFLQTIFRRDETAAFFFTNDLKVLVDIIVRELTDLPVADVVRCDYLNVLHVLVRNSPWVLHGKYRVVDLYNALVSIMQSEDASMHQMAPELVKRIFDDCGEFFE